MDSVPSPDFRRTDNAFVNSNRRQLDVHIVDTVQCKHICRISWGIGISRDCIGICTTIDSFSTRTSTVRCNWRLYVPFLCLSSEHRKKIQFCHKKLVTSRITYREHINFVFITVYRSTLSETALRHILPIFGPITTIWNHTNSSAV